MKSIESNYDLFCYSLYCGNEHWTLAGDLITPLAFSAGDINLGGNSYPSVLLLCSNCGNSKVFNAVIMKILEV